MKRDDIEGLKDAVGCHVLLDAAGFAIDAKESTKRSMKYRRMGDIIIVIHDGRGWFDPLGDAKGDVFGLAIHLERCSFLDALAHVAALSDGKPTLRPNRQIERHHHSQLPAADIWAGRAAPSPGSAAWRYLTAHRALPVFVLRAAADQGVLREGPRGSLWAAHKDEVGNVCG